MIRAAFGVSKITYYAFSYGTYLGQVYATLFPSRVRRMVLDSTVDPTGVWYADNIAQDYAFQGRVNAFFAWTAKYDSIYHLGTTAAAVEQAYNRARAMLEATPADVPGHPQIGPDELDDTYREGGYANWYWPQLARRCRTTLHGGSQRRLLSGLPVPGHADENEFAVYNAVHARTWTGRVTGPSGRQTLTRSTRPRRSTRGATRGSTRRAPSGRSRGQPSRCRSRARDCRHPDAAGHAGRGTPYAGAQDAHKALPSARMVVVEGGGNHGQSLTSPVNPCVMKYLNDYLGTGVLPEAPGLVNATCPTRPRADPGSLVLRLSVLPFFALGWKHVAR